MSQAGLEDVSSIGDGTITNAQVYVRAVPIVGAAFRELVDQRRARCPFETCFTHEQVERVEPSNAHAV
jgi:hypothetical protein